MKGFGLEIKNNLLDAKHVKQMGIAIWLYMLFIDKMTSINEAGIGKILGGKPIKYEVDIKDEIGISERTYNRWVETLEGQGYINVVRAPYGLVITVNKAHKRFGRSITKREPSDVAELGKENRQMWRNSRTNVADLIKTGTVDNNNNTEHEVFFEKFWIEYPRKVSKKKSFQIWKRLKVKKDLFDKIMKTLLIYKKSSQWVKDNGLYIPHPSTFLNQERWEDESIDPQQSPVFQKRICKKCGTSESNLWVDSSLGMICGKCM